MSAPTPPPTARSMRAAFEKRLVRMAHVQPLWRVFADFCELAALSYANVVERRPDREERYAKILADYPPDEQRAFPELLAMVIGAHEEDWCDFLGESFMALELSSHWKGQFFTPYSLCSAMARLTIGDEVKATVKERGFATIHEPACGAGALVLACAEAFLAYDLNPQTQLHVTAVDIDSTAAHMTFVQLCVRGVPAAVLVGDTLRMTFRDEWLTPAHHLGGWGRKLRRGHALGSPAHMATLPAVEPVVAPEAAPARPPDVVLGEQLGLFGPRARSA